MFHSRTLNNRINKIHERALRLVYKDEAFLSFDDLLKSDKSVSIHQKNLPILTTEIYKAKNDLGPKIMKDTESDILTCGSFSMVLKYSHYFYQISPPSWC